MKKTLGIQVRPERVVQVLLYGAILATPAYYAWDTFRLVAYGPQDPPPDRELTRISSPEEGSGTRVTTEMVRDWRLFGGSGETAPGNDETVEQEVAASSKLRLLGVFDMDRHQLASAIIEKSDDKQKRYYTGSSITPEMTLKSVHPDHVVVNTARGARKLALKAPGGDQVDISENNKTDKNDNQGDNEEDKESKEQYNIGLLKNAGLKPVEPGKAKGYKVTEKFIENQSDTYGLKEGDIIVSANGYPLGTEESDRLAYKSYETAESVDAIVRRDGTQITVRYP